MRIIRNFKVPVVLNCIRQWKVDVIWHSQNNLNTTCQRIGKLLCYFIQMLNLIMKEVHGLKYCSFIIGEQEWGSGVSNFSFTSLSVAWVLILLPDLALYISRMSCFWFLSCSQVFFWILSISSPHKTQHFEITIWSGTSERRACLWDFSLPNYSYFTSNEFSSRENQKKVRHGT